MLRDTRETSDRETPLRLGRYDERPKSREEAEWRVLRALATMRTPGVVKDANQGVGSASPAYVHDALDLKWQQELVADDDPLDIFRPDRRDLSDWLYALAWFTQIPRKGDRHPKAESWSLTREQKVIRWRSRGLDDGVQPSWEFIAGKMGKRTAGAVRGWYELGIDRVWAAARIWQPGDAVVIWRVPKSAIGRGCD